MNTLLSRDASDSSLVSTERDTKLESCLTVASSTKEGEGVEETGDAVFGVKHAGDVDYVSVSFWGSTILMTKTLIGIGSLAMPSVFATIGVIPGVLSIVLLSGFSTYAGWMMGTFKLRHRSVFTVGDVGFLLAGPIGREVVGGLFLLLMITIAGAAYLAMSIALNAVTSHATCTMVFVAVATVISALLSSIQTLSKISIISWIGLVSIVSAIVTLTVAVGLHGRPMSIPEDAVIESKMFVEAHFSHAMTAIGNVIFAFCGAPAFLNVASEMREPEKYTKAMLIAQGFVTFCYLFIGLVVYHFAGAYVSSPALASAGLYYERVCYGLAMLGLLAGAVIYTHLSAKYIFVRALRHSEHLTKSSRVHYTVWFMSVGGCAVVAFLLASAIPVFSGLLGVIGSVLGSFFCFVLPGAMWFFDNWERRAKGDRSRGFIAMCALNGFMVVSGGFLIVAGGYGSIADIMQSLKDVTPPFSCADNS